MPLEICSASVRKKLMEQEIEKNINKKIFFDTMKRPLFFAVVNFFLVNTLFAFLPYNLGAISYNIIRVTIIFYAGWLVVRKNLGTIWHAALAGILVYFTDHVVLKGGVFILNYLFKPEGMGLAAFSGVMVSFVLFTPLAMAVAALGGLAARNNQA
jgi:hypothetical protein